jgi:hypothetical protein
MVTLHSKLFNYAGMALVMAALLLSGAPAMAWSYGHYGGHHYGYYGSYYKPYRSHHYGGYYRHYPYYGSGNRHYRRNSYSEPDYTTSSSDQYSSVVASSGAANADDKHGWTLLAGGDQESALKTFSTQAQNDPKNGALKVGYALATAETGDLDRGVWAMRRAVRIDPDALHYLRLDEDMQGIVNNLIHRYEDDDYHTLEATDRDFMVASLYYLLHNAEAAARILPDKDTHTSTQNLGRLIQQMRADEGAE